MKESLLRIKNKIKRLFSLKTIKPHTDWKNLLYIFFIIIILLIIFSFYIFNEMRKQQEFEIIPKSTKSPTLINDKLLKKVTGSFDNKLLKEKEIRGGLIKYKDPSIK